MVSSWKDVFWVVCVIKYHLYSSKLALGRHVTLEAKLANLRQEHLLVRIQLVINHSVDFIDIVSRKVCKFPYSRKIPWSMNFIVPVLARNAYCHKLFQDFIHVS